MKLKILSCLLSLAMGELREKLSPNIPTFAKFTGLTVELDNTDSVYVVQKGESSGFDQGGAQFSLVPEKTNRGIFVRICDLNSIELKKVQINAQKFSTQKEPVIVDIGKLFTDYAFDEDDSKFFKELEIKAQQDVLYENCQVLSIRGVYEVNFEILQEVKEPFIVEITSEEWMITYETKWYFVCVATFPLLFAMAMCFLKGWCFCKVFTRYGCCIRRQNQLKIKLKKGEVSNQDTCIKWIQLVLFNFDLISDFVYTGDVPFYTVWLKTMSVMTLLLPLVIILLPSFSVIFYGCYKLLQMVQNGEYTKNQQKRKDIIHEYILKMLLIAALACFNGIQFLDKSMQERFEGNSEFQRLRIQSMEKEIDEEILKVDSQKSNKTLHKNVIKQFRKFYPDDLTVVKELQEDYTIFMDTWNTLADKGKGYRIKYENVTNFFKQIGNQKFVTKKISDNEKNLKGLEIKKQVGGAKKQLQSNYVFDENKNEVISSSSVVGKIYRAQLRTQKEFEVAIQVVDKKKNLKNIEIITDAFKEMKILNHPNIANYYESYEDEKNLYIVMEYVEQIDNIRKFIDNDDDENDDENDDEKADEAVEDDANAKEQNAYRLIKQLLSALNHMHSDNLLHRDIRPENVMLDKDDNIKLVDLQLFQENCNQQFCEDEQILYYVPPEVLHLRKDQVHECQKSGDIWGAGIILYNLLTGNQPFQGEEENEITDNIKKNEINVNNDDFQNVSLKAKDLLLKMLEKDPNQRITAEQALKEPWFNVDDQQQNKWDKAYTRIILKRLKNFKKRSMLKQMALVQLVELQKSVNETQEITKLEKVFEKFDTNNTTKMTSKEILDAFHEYNISTSPERIQSIINEVDYLQTGSISLREFVCATLDFQKFLESEEGMKTLRSVFNKFQQQFSVEDSETKNYITREDIILAWNNLGADYKITEDQIAEIFEQHDLGRDNVVHWEEFLTIFQDVSQKDIGKIIQKEFDQSIQKTKLSSLELRINVRKNVLIKQIEKIMNFKQDDGYICFSEFIYKIFRFKYKKLNINIFQIRTESLFKQEDDFDRIIEMMVEKKQLADDLIMQQTFTKNEKTLHRSAKSDELELHDDTKVKLRSGSLQDSQNSRTEAKIHKKNQVASQKEYANEPLSPYAINIKSKFKQVFWESKIQKRHLMNKIYALDVEVQLAQKQDVYLYFANIKGIKMTKPQMENHFADHDLREVISQDILQSQEQFDPNTELSFDEFKKYTENQMLRYSRMCEFEFIYPEEKIKLKYEWLEELAIILGNEHVTVGTVKDFQDEKSKPFYNNFVEDEGEENDQDGDGQDEEKRLILPTATTIDIKQVKEIFERIMDSRLHHYMERIEKLRKIKPSKTILNLDVKKQSSNKFTDTHKEQSHQFDPIFSKFNKQLLKQKLKGSTFKQIGINIGDFTICLGDKQDLRGSRPYIDNSMVNKYNFEDLYEDLVNPYIYVEQQMMIARMKVSGDLLVLQFNRSFNKIIDGMRCKENVEGSDNTDAKFIYTHTFNNWINKKESNENYYRKKYSFLVEDKQRMGFILTKPDKEKDEEDRLQEERIRSKVKERTEEQWYNEDKDFKKQASLARSGVSFAFGILEDIPQLALQTLNSILIGQTMTWIQILSPLFSFSSVFVRIYGLSSWELFPESDSMNAQAEEKCQALSIMTCINIFFMSFCFLPIVLIVFKNYYVKEQVRLDWVEANFENVRYWEARFF